MATRAATTTKLVYDCVITTPLTLLSIDPYQQYDPAYYQQQYGKDLTLSSIDQYYQQPEEEPKQRSSHEMQESNTVRV